MSSVPPLDLVTFNNRSSPQRSSHPDLHRSTLPRRRRVMTTKTGGEVVQSWVHPDLAQRLRSHAAHERRSVSAVIRLAIERTLDGPPEASLAASRGEGPAGGNGRALETGHPAPLPPATPSTTETPA